MTNTIAPLYMQTSAFLMKNFSDIEIYFWSIHIYINFLVSSSSSSSTFFFSLSAHFLSLFDLDISCFYSYLFCFWSIKWITSVKIIQNKNKFLLKNHLRFQSQQNRQATGDQANRLFSENSINSFIRYGFRLKDGQNSDTHKSQHIRYGQFNNVFIFLEQIFYCKHFVIISRR